MEESTVLKGTCCKHIHMIGGDGPNSYAHNSEYQKQSLISAEDLILKLINKHLNTLDSHTTFRIADFGCSIGPNTFFAVENVISAVINKYNQSNKNQSPDFQVFFNDLVDNDFNTLFKNLPSNRNYLVAGVPGSFHARLFPKKSIDFALCSTALHWLSKIPNAAIKRGDNYSGKIHYLGGEKVMKDAYAAQFEEDFGGFLRARGDEVVGGGLMVLVVLGFADGVDSSESGIGMTFQILGSCLEEMANLGNISKEKMNSFKLPFYYPSPSEVKALVESNGLFDIEKVSKLGGRKWPHKADPQVVASHLRAVIGVLIEQHFGNGMVDQLFKRYLDKFMEDPMLVDENYATEANYFLFLKRIK